MKHHKTGRKNENEKIYETLDAAAFNFDGLRGNILEQCSAGICIYGRGQVSRTLNAGTYYLKMRTYRDHDFRITAEPLITLARVSITSLKSNKSGQLTVSCKSVPYAIGYRIQYSTDYRFRKGVKTIYSPVRIKTLTKLSKGKRYYVRVTPYTVYTDGEHAWGATSYVKSAERLS